MSETCSKHVPCKEGGQTQTPLSDTAATPNVMQNTLGKVPVVLAERTIQIVVESNISLDPQQSKLNVC